MSCYKDFRLFLILLPISFRLVEGLNNGLALTPPMIWYTGQRFELNVDCKSYPKDCISESLIISTIDALIKNGYKDQGYEYICIGDGWSARTRDPKDNSLLADPKRFPRGIQYLTEYAHRRSLKLGLFLGVNNLTAGSYPGSEFYTKQDADTVAKWGVDLVYADGGGENDAKKLDKRFIDLGQKLNETGKHILYACGWPMYQNSPNYTLISKTCNLYQVLLQQRDIWEDLDKTIKFTANEWKSWKNYTGAGSWIILNQLMIGNFGSSTGHEEIQMALWTELSSAILSSSDIRSMRLNAKKILLNKQIININRDKLKTMGKIATIKGQVYIWLRPISPQGSFALSLFYVNMAGGPTKQSWKLSSLGLITAAQYNITNLFNGDYLGIYKPWHTLDCEVNPNGVLYFNVSAIQ